MKCRAVSYEGEQPFVFFSYCHADAEKVYPVMERLYELGIRFWYDNGLHAGDDWPEVIADHLDKCSVVLVMMSPASADSHNCRRELTTALEWKKTLAVVMMEDFPLSKGMQMQLCNTQHLNYFDYPNVTSFSSVLAREPILEACLGPRRLLADPEPGAVNEVLRSNPEKKKLDDFKIQDDRVEEKKPVKSQADVQGAVIKEKVTIQPEVQEPEDDEKTIALDLVMESPHITEIAEEPKDPIGALIIVNDNRVFRLEKEVIRIGRSERKCDLPLSGHPSVSGLHAELSCKEGKYWLEDIHSSNGTYMEGKRIVPGEKVELKDQYTRFTLADTECMLVKGKAGEWFAENKTLAWLSCGTENIYLDDQGLILGRRDEEWPEAAHGVKTITRGHASMVFLEGTWKIVDRSSNGTIVNGNRIPREVPIALHPGDLIQMGHLEILFNSITLE